MKQANNIFWIVLCGLLVLLNAYSFYQNKRVVQDLETVEASMSTNQQKVQAFIDNIFNREMVQYRSEGKTIDEGLVFRAGAEKQEKYTLGKLLTDEYTFVFDLSSINCTKCTEQYEIELVKELADEISPAKILLLARYRNPEDLDLFKRLNNFYLKVYNKEDKQFGLPVEEEGVPYMFLVNPDLKARYLFIPDQELPALSEKYFNFIKQKLTEVNNIKQQ